jgi:hypothetical protein
MAAPKLVVPGAPLPFIRLTMNSVQTINNSSLTTLSFDTVSCVGNGWSAPTPPVTALAIPFSGIYLVCAHDMDWADTAVALGTGIRRIGRQLSAGAATRRMLQTSVGAGGSANNQTVQSGVEVMYLPAGETLSVICLQTSGGSLSAGLNDLFVQCLQLGTFIFSGTN